MAEKLEIVPTDGDNTALVKAEDEQDRVILIKSGDVPTPEYVAMRFPGTLHHGGIRPPVIMSEAQATKECLKALRQEFRDMFAAARKRAGNR